MTVCANHTKENAHVSGTAIPVGDQSTHGVSMTDSTNYSQFVARKLTTMPPVGLNVSHGDYGMFPHQKDLVRFALRRGRSAIFADTGLGKTRMQTAWADVVQKEIKRDVLILAPLAVAEQTVEEAASVGVTDSWEAYYQAVRRCWRFGQKRPVDVHIFSSEQEGAVVANLKRKEEDARRMSDALASEVMESVRSELLGVTRETNIYNANKRVVVPSFLKAA